MTDREKVVSALEKALAISGSVDSCFIWITVGDGRKALKLLKEQETRSVNNGDDTYVCGECGETVGWEELSVGGIYKTRYKYCPECGRKVKWDAAD